ncbi:MAG TPA: VOC family protein [Burkholderiales bacterium]|nr:VOC family protein [Burkholderiales bacterium]
MQVQPYLMFDGRCEEAIEFYRNALGAEVQALIRGEGDRVMHTCLRIGETAVMASDGQCAGKPGFHGFSLSVTAADDAEARKRFRALADGGQVQMPLSKTFFASSFGMVADRFGVSWMIVANPAVT